MTNLLPEIVFHYYLVYENIKVNVGGSHIH